MHAHPLPSSRRYVTPLVLLLVAALAGACLSLMRPPPASAAAEDSFVTRCGIRFCLDGEEYYVAGANAYDLFTFGSGSGDTETQYMDKERIDAHMARMRYDGVDVVRLWMFSHESWHGFEKSEGVYDEQQFALFDYVIESARTHGLRLMPVFENYWEAYGGIDTRLGWEGLSGGQPARAAFFDKDRCPGCFTSYKNYVSHALNRTNHYSGVKYKDDPTIFAWDLMNEPRYEGQSDEENVEGTTLRAWVDEMGAFVKEVDPNHLLGAGIEGHGTQYGFGGDEGNPFVHLQQSPYLDFTSAHPYSTEYWADLTLDETKELVRAWITDSHEKVGKPFFMGEFNVHNSTGRPGGARSTPTSRRPAVTAAPSGGTRTARSTGSSASPRAIRNSTCSVPTPPAWPPRAVTPPRPAPRPPRPPPESRRRPPSRPPHRTRPAHPPRPPRSAHRAGSTTGCRTGEPPSTRTSRSTTPAARRSTGGSCRSPSPAASR